MRSSSGSEILRTGDHVPFGVLGPVRFVSGGRDVEVGRGRVRALLGFLLLNANRQVATAELVAGLWDAPPRTARTALHGSISRLRGVLEHEMQGGLRGRLLTASAGYQFRLRAGELDLDVFEARVRDARVSRAAGRQADASRTLDEALSLWRGAPLGDLAGEPFTRNEIGRLNELRMAAVEELMDLELALGRHASVVAELTRLVSEHPFRERLQRLLMLALYRSGRQAEALEVFGSARRALVDELGLEPAIELRRLHEAILTHAPELDIDPISAGMSIAAATTATPSGKPGWPIDAPVTERRSTVPRTARNREGTLKKILDLHGYLSELDSVAKVRSVAVTALTELVGGDGAYYSGIHRHEGLAPTILQYAEWQSFVKVLDEQLLSHPIVDQWSRTPDASVSVLSMSDVIGQREFRRSALYCDGYRPLGVDGGVWIATGWNQAGTWGYALWGRRWYWRASELETLEMIAGVLARAEQSVRERVTAEASVRAIGQALEMKAGGVVITDRDRAVVHATQQAQLWMKRFGSRAGRLPETIDRWLQARQRGDDARATVQIPSADGPIRVDHRHDAIAEIEILQLTLTPISKRPEPNPLERRIV